jgi:flagellar hook protein FlgE
MQHSTLKLGKLPAASSQPVKLKFRDFLDRTQLPPLPKGDFGHDSLVTNWGMLGNDKYGDCVLAGAGHEHMLWLREAGHTEAEVTSLFTEKAALKNYSAVTGFNPDDPDTDQGTDMAQAASYRRKTGYIDSKGNRHKIGAYVDLDPGNITELWYAAWLFDGVGIGVNFPSQWMDAFNKGSKGLWDHVSRPKLEGGHYITGVGRHGNLNIVTWADDHPRLTPRGYAQFNDQTIAYASAEKLVSGRDDNGFDWPGLLAALKEIDGQP